MVRATGLAFILVVIFFTSTASGDVLKTPSVSNFMKDAELVAVVEIVDVIGVDSSVSVNGEQIPNRWSYQAKVKEQWKGSPINSVICSNKPLSTGDHVLLVRWIVRPAAGDEKCHEGSEYFEAGIGRELFPVKLEFVDGRYDQYVVFREELFSDESDSYDLYASTRKIETESGRVMLEERLGYMRLEKVRRFVLQAFGKD